MASRTRALNDGTRVIHAGHPAPGQGEPFAAGPTFAATYHLSGDPAGQPYGYGRFGNPTWTGFERAIEELEGGPAVVFGSGMAAVTSIFGTLLRPGDVVVLPSDSYYTARVAAEGYFAELGIQVRTAPTVGDGLLDQLDAAKLLWLETPTNPGMDVCDIAALAEAAHRVGALVAVDNTTPTPLGQIPLALGADFSVASGTKALTGHSDLILGHVAVAEPERLEPLLRWRTQMGAIPGPMEVWLAHRSLATLDVRLERMCRNAARLAAWLRDQPGVRNVRYPGLPDDPSHALASRQMRRFGHLLCFELGDRSIADRFLEACSIVFEATSFGGVHSTAERRARWGGDPVPDGFIRLSAGCEDADDLIADLARALEEAG
ncbi:MAG TPA: cystathionine gamma-lyase [Longimicrobiaceae bacterium]|nr:cystathionine gamma-lyase [Longimicrobiaceae bacterium]